MDQIVLAEVVAAAAAATGCLVAVLEGALRPHRDSMAAEKAPMHCYIDLPGLGCIPVADRGILVGIHSLVGSVAVACWVVHRKG